MPSRGCLVRNTVTGCRGCASGDAVGQATEMRAGEAAPQRRGHLARGMYVIGSARVSQVAIERLGYEPREFLVLVVLDEVVEKLDGSGVGIADADVGGVVAELDVLDSDLGRWP